RARVLGQPWALLGYTQHAQIGLIQVAAVTGVYGVSFLVALGNAAIVEALVALREGRGRREAGAALAVPAAVIGGGWLRGMARAPAARAAATTTSNASCSSPRPDRSPLPHPRRRTRARAISPPARPRESSRASSPSASRSATRSSTRT